MKPVHLRKSSLTLHETLTSDIPSVLREGHGKPAAHTRGLRADEASASTRGWLWPRRPQPPETTHQAKATLRPVRASPRAACPLAWALVGSARALGFTDVHKERTLPVIRNVNKQNAEKQPDLATPVASCFPKRSVCHSAGVSASITPSTTAHSQFFSFCIAYIFITLHPPTASAQLCTALVTLHFL